MIFPNDARIAVDKWRSIIDKNIIIILDKPQVIHRLCTKLQADTSRIFTDTVM